MTALDKMCQFSGGCCQRILSMKQCLGTHCSEKKTGSSKVEVHADVEASIVPAASVSAGASTERAASTETAVEMEGCSVHCKWQLCVQDGDKTGACSAPRSDVKTCANDDVLNCDDEEYPHANMQCAAMPPPPPWVMPVSNTAPMPPFPRELFWLAVAAVVALIVIKGRTLYKLLPQDEQQPPPTPPPPPAPPTPNTQDEESAVTAKLRAEKEMAEAQAEKARAETQRAYAEADRATAEADKARAEAARAERASFAALDRIEGMSDEIKGLRDEVTRNLKDIAIAPPTPPKLLIDAFEPQFAELRAEIASLNGKKAVDEAIAEEEEEEAPPAPSPSLLPSEHASPPRSAKQNLEEAFADYQVLERPPPVALSSPTGSSSSYSPANDSRLASSAWPGASSLGDQYAPYDPRTRNFQQGVGRPSRSSPYSPPQPPYDMSPSQRASRSRMML